MQSDNDHRSVNNETTLCFHSRLFGQGEKPGGGLGYYRTPDTPLPFGHPSGPQKNPMKAAILISGMGM